MVVPGSVVDFADGVGVGGRRVFSRLMTSDLIGGEKGWVGRPLGQYPDFLGSRGWRVMGQSRGLR